MKFRILGPLEIHTRDTTLDAGTPRTRVLLAVLLTASGQLVSIDRLIDELPSCALPRLRSSTTPHWPSGRTSSPS